MSSKKKRQFKRKSAAERDIAQTLKQFEGGDIPPAVRKQSWSPEVLKDCLVGYRDPDEEGGLVTMPVYGIPYTWERLLKEEGTELEKDEEGNVIIILPREKAQYYAVEYQVTPIGTGGKRPLMCVFDATKEYCRTMFGITLTRDDEDYFITHPKVNSDGVEMAHTMQVVQELVAPYGLRVARVRVAPGQNVLGPVWDEWQKVLRVNPLAAMDRRTTNAEWSAQSPKDPTDYRFEYSGSGLRPSISCGIVSASSGYSTGSTMGHATFVSPRSHISGAMLSIQLARATDVPWRGDITMGPLYAEERENATPKTTTLPIGFELSEWARDNPERYPNYKSTGGYGGRRDGDFPADVVSSTKTPGTTVVTQTVCVLCMKATRVACDPCLWVCRKCWDVAMTDLECNSSNCQRARDSMFPPKGTFGYWYWNEREQKLYIQCQSCWKVFTVSSESGTDSSNIRKLWEAAKMHFAVSKGDNGTSGSSNQLAC